MKIAVFHELPQGGARRAINEYARQLKKKHLVDLFLVDDNKSSNEDKFYSNVFFYKFIPKFWKGNNWRIRLYKDTIELINLYKFNRKIARDIDNKQYDLCLVSSSKFIEAPFIMRFLKTPFIFYCQDPNYRIIYDDILRIKVNLNIAKYLYETLNRFLRKFLDKQNVSHINLCIAPSKYIAKGFTKTYQKKSIVVYYGVDISFFRPSAKIKDIDIFYIGSKTLVDGYDTFRESVDLMAIKPMVKTILVDEEWISDDRKLRDLYQRSKIVVCTARKEGLGAVALEAMACGVPVVAVDEAGHKETVVDRKTGYLVERNPKKIAEKLDWLLLHTSELLKIGNNCREIMIKKWTWQSRTQELNNVIVKYLIKRSVGLKIDLNN